MNKTKVHEYLRHKLLTNIYRIDLIQVIDYECHILLEALLDLEAPSIGKFGLACWHLACRNLLTCYTSPNSVGSISLFTVFPYVLYIKTAVSVIKWSSCFYFDLSGHPHCFIQQATGFDLYGFAGNIITDAIDPIG